MRRAVAGRVSRRQETDQTCNGDDEDQENNERKGVRLHWSQLPAALPVEPDAPVDEAP